MARTDGQLHLFGRRRQALDGLLILHLIDRDLDIRYAELPDLAGALYGAHSEDAVQEVYGVIAQMARDGLIQEIDDDVALRRPPKEPTPLSVRGITSTSNGSTPAGVVLSEVLAAPEQAEGP